MTDNEIIKAFDNLLNRKWVIAESNGKFITMGDVADLINRQKAEIEKLEKVEHFADKIIATQKAEIERLRHIATRETSQSMIPAIVRRAKAEARKEFVERLCEDRVANDPVVIAAKCLLERIGG